MSAHVRAMAGAAAFLLAAPAAAQLTTAATASGDIGGVMVPSPECGQVFEPGVTVGCSRSGPAGAFFAGEARTDAGGRLRARSSAAARGADSLTRGTGTASWTERVLYDPLTEPTRVVQSIRITGGQNGSLSGDGDGLDAATFAFMRLWIDRDGTQGERDEILFRRSMLLWSPGLRQDLLGLQRTVRGVDGAFMESEVGRTARVFDLTLEFWLDPGSSFYDLTWQFALNSLVLAGARGQVSANYSRTVAWTGLQFFDADNQDVTLARGIRFASGADYRLGGPAAGPIPEPSTWVLLLAGFGLVGLAARRRAEPGAA